ncbi:hypothetical protein [Methylomonas sp. AM2-LC]|uniref:hypothetical protein n=1 Tax=Methylomonas sp. AM2-LC TaxID=3153301 RepID=UPI003263A078
MKIKSAFKLKTLATLIMGLSVGNVYASNTDLTTWTASQSNLVTFSNGTATLNTGDGLGQSTYAYDSKSSTASFTDGANSSIGNLGLVGAILSDTSFSVTGNQILTFNWEFTTQSGTPYNDFALVDIGGTQYQLESIIKLHNAKDSGLETASIALAPNFSGTVSFVISHEGYDSYNSALSISNLSIAAAPVPEAEVLIMMLLGLPLMSLAVRYKQKTA